jgi:tripartite-type tricarboxylate transporter receptor subunit TctC
MRRSSSLIPAFGIYAVIGAASATAQEFPSKPIEMVIPFAQGGGTDRVGRMFSDHAEQYLGVDVVPSNRTGGSGAVGFAHGAMAPPDGYTLTMAVTTLTVAPSTMDGYPVTYESFAPVCLLAALPMTISVRADSPYQTVEDLIAATKDKSEPLNIGTAGAATNNYLAGVAFAGEAGIDATPVPYDGAGPALVALLGGHVDAAMSDASEVLPYVESGQLRPLLVMGDEPVPTLPGVPTAQSKGFDVNVASFRGVAAPAGTPEDVMTILTDTCEKVASDPAFVEDMGKFGMDVTLILGEEFGDWLQRQHETYAKAAAAAGLSDS